MKGCATILSMGMMAMAAAPSLRAAGPGDFTADAPAAPSRYESVYAPPAPVTADQGTNAGAVHTDISVSYFTDYVYRGLERFDNDLGHEDALNLQFSGKMSFDLGKGPHPFIGLFTNVASGDPNSNVQELRPTFGADWSLRPLTLTVGLNTYVFPGHNDLQTSEVYGKLRLDDSYFTMADKPLLNPYILGAYDYDLYNGWYLEAGVEHVFDIEDIGLTLTAQAGVAYVRGFDLFAGDGGSDTGWQHYRLGLIADYSLNTLLNVPRRYGEWSLRGYLFYTDGIADHLQADTGLYGGGGIAFRY